MSRFQQRISRLPTTELVTAPETKRLHEKFVEAQRLVQADAFWKAVQDRRQPNAVRNWSWDANGSPVDFEELPVG